MVSKKCMSFLAGLAAIVCGMQILAEAGDTYVGARYVLPDGDGAHFSAGHSILLSAQSAPSREESLRLSRLDPTRETTESGSTHKPAGPAAQDAASHAIEAAVIRPYRQATVGAEVQGVVEARHAEEGDLIQAGQVVYEISPELFRLAAERARERLLAQEEVQKQAEEEAKLKNYLFLHNAATQQDVLKARSQAKIAEHRTNEARKDLELALRDLNKCRVKGPFKGHIVTLYREQYEPVQRFDQLFLIADTSKVYAVVNVPETLLSHMRKGAGALFKRSTDGTFHGTVKKIGKAIDPASKTKKVYILIDNPDGKLEMGMLGSVIFLPNKREAQ